MAGEPDPSATSARTCAGREEMGIVPEALQNRAHLAILWVVELQDLGR
jgi:hypothetical protein